MASLRNRLLGFAEEKKRSAEVQERDESCQKKLNQAEHRNLNVDSACSHHSSDVIKNVAPLDNVSVIHSVWS